MKRTTFIAAMLCLLGAGLSCTHDEPNNSDTGTGQRVVEWQDSTLSGDAVMGEKMIFKVGGGMSVERSEGTRASTDVNGIAKFTVNDLVTIGLTRGVTDETKNYKVTATSQTSADPEVWTSSLAYNGSASDAFFWKSTGESVNIRAWSYGDGSTTSSDPDNQTYTLSEDQSASYGELLYSKATPFDYEHYSGGIPIQFCHQMTRLVISLTHIKPGDLDISEIYIGDGSETPIPTTAKFHKPTSGDIGTWDNIGSEKGQITPKTEAANSCYSAVLIPTTYEVADKKFVIIKTSDSRTYCYIPNENLTLVAGTQYNYTISVKDLKEVSTLTIGDIADYTYDGTAKTPTPIVKDGTKTLVKDTDYELSYSNNINAGTATVTVTGKGGYYSGTQSKTFTINRCPTTLTFAASSETVDYIWNQTKYNLTKSPNDATVEFTSSNTALVGVDASTGALKGGTAFINSGTATITVTATGNYIGSATYTINTTNYVGFSCTKTAQSIALPKGKYLLQCWGASGGGETDQSIGSHRGLGGYSYGNYSITGTGTTTLFVFVGGKGQFSTSTNADGGWNGGGSTLVRSGSNGSSGGGMTHISTTNNPSTPVISASSTWNPSGTLIVAGGGGGTDDGTSQWAGTLGGSNDGSGGYGGGESGGEPRSEGAFLSGKAGTQSSGYKQGIGEPVPGTNHDAGGGGGGWWGGKWGGVQNSSGGGGGSGYIGGVSTPKETIAGNSSFPAPGGGNETGHAGDGYARISWVSN